jgi:hypothetical protein
MYQAGTFLGVVLTVSGDTDRLTSLLDILEELRLKFLL